MMGGNMEGLGNITTTAEFNFFADPESAHVVINKLGKIGGPVKTTIVTYELCKRNFYTLVIDKLSIVHKRFRFRNNVLELSKSWLKSLGTQLWKYSSVARGGGCEGAFAPPKPMVLCTV
jgi:inosine-uridine nucleoside N-ribohydrolase